MTACRYDSDSATYLLRSHKPTCTAIACPGCVPCIADKDGNPTRHCENRTNCAGHLTDDQARTCTSCIARTRNNLQRIEDLAAHLPDEATERGVNSEAAVLAGPAADPAEWDYKKTRIRVMLMRLPKHLQPTQEDVESYRDDPHHPLAVLGRWELEYRTAYDQPTTLKTTLSRARDYLDGMLTRVAQDDRLDFAQFSAEVAACCTHLEDVLSDSRRPETGAPCPRCPKGAKPRLVKRYARHDLTGASDSWRCPRDDSHRWTEAEYRLRITDDYLDNADALTAGQIEIRYGIPAGSVRGWAARGRVARRGRDGSGRQLYDVSGARLAAGQVREGA